MNAFWTGWLRRLFGFRTCDCAGGSEFGDDASVLRSELTDPEELRAAGAGTGLGKPGTGGGGGSGIVVSDPKARMAVPNCMESCSGWRNPHERYLGGGIGAPYPR